MHNALRLGEKGWQKNNNQRQSNFIPDRQGSEKAKHQAPLSASANTPVRRTGAIEIGWFTHVLVVV
jgi:hypothetical protein